MTIRNSERLMLCHPGAGNPLRQRYSSWCQFSRLDVCEGSFFSVQIDALIGPQLGVKLKQMARKPTYGFGLPLLGVLLP
jgi:hypothetical protein